MVRNKGTTGVKRATLEPEEKVLNMRLPSVRQPEYSMSNVRVADAEYLQDCLRSDIEYLRKDLKFRQSCGETEIQPFIQEALTYCE